MKKTDVLVLLFIILASAYALSDLFIPGFFTSHDGPHQIVRAFYYHDLINKGYFPPRYVFGLNYGFGYPLFIFSYHAPWLIAEIWARLGFTIIDSVKMTFLTGYILSGIFMYFYQKYLFGRIAAFAGTLLYLYSPFRFSNIFVRSAIGDATALIFAPLAFWAYDLIRKSKNLNYLYIIFFAFSMSALLISHAMIFFFFSSAIFLYAAFRFINAQSKMKLFISLVLSILLFISFSSFYLLPSLFERNFTKFNDIMGPLATVTDYITISKLIYSPWGYGTVDAQYGPMSLSVGPVSILILLASLFCLVYLFIKGKLSNTPKSAYGVIFSFIFLITVFLMHPTSESLWKKLSDYFIIDFNWRVLNLTVFTSSLLSGWLIFQIRNKRTHAALTAFVLIVMAFYTNRNHLRINQTLDWSVPFFLKLEKTTNSFEEYLPKWAATHFIKENLPRIASSDRFSYELLKENADYYDLKVNVMQKGRLTMNISYYPGWEAYVDGKKVKIDYEPKGLIEIPLETGSHRLTVKFTRTPLRLTADLITASSLLFTGIYIVRKKING